MATWHQLIQPGQGYTGGNQDHRHIEARLESAGLSAADLVVKTEIGFTVIILCMIIGYPYPIWSSNAKDRVYPPSH